MKPHIKPTLANNRDLRSTACDNKYYYHTWEFAKQQAERYKQRFDAPRQRAYKCAYCPYYHIGRTDKLFKVIKR